MTFHNLSNSQTFQTKYFKMFNFVNLQFSHLFKTISLNIVSLQYIIIIHLFTQLASSMNLVSKSLLESIFHPVISIHFLSLKF